MGRIVDIFYWTWIGRTGNTSKQQKMAASNEEFICESGFEAVLATFQLQKKLGTTTTQA